MTKYIVGIDLGTSTTIVSSLTNFTPQAVPDPYEANLTFTPSAVLIRPGQEAVVGMSALNRREVEPDSVVVEAKRFMGTNTRLPNENGLLAHEVLAEILRYRLKHLVPLAAGARADVISAVISVPAEYGDAQRKSTERAWEIATTAVSRNGNVGAMRFELIGLVHEPLAAAIYHSFEEVGLFDGKPFLVLDLGGGTFDVTAYTADLVAHRNCLFVNVLAKDGDNRLGGADWDMVLAEMWSKNAKTAFPQLSRAEQYELLKACEEARRQNLGTMDDAVIKGAVGERNVRMKVTRGEFEDHSRQLLARLNACISRTVDRVKEQTGLDEKSYQVLLVGGGTHMPMVQNLARDRFGAAHVRQHRFPLEAVSLGACLYCAIRNGTQFSNPNLRRIQQIEVCDILNRSYGILGRDRSSGHSGLQVIIPRNALCNGSEYAYTEATVANDADRELSLVFSSVSQFVLGGEFVALPENDPDRPDQPVVLRIPPGQIARADQPVHIFLSPQMDGMIHGRATLMDFGNPPRRVCDVEFHFRT